MKRNKLALILIMIFLILLVSLCTKELFMSKKQLVGGIHVSGSESDYNFSPEYGKQIINIKSDGLTISGKAQADTYILVAGSVSTLMFEDLNQDQWKIIVQAKDISNKPDNLKISYSGTNEICLIEQIGNLSLNSNELNASLLLSSGIHFIDSLKLSNGNIEAGYFIVSGDINIIGKVNLKLKSTEDELMDDNLWASRMDAINLYVNLDEGGRIDISDCSEYYPIYARKLILNGNTKLIQPIDGIIVNYNDGDGPYSSDGTIFDAEGKDAQHVTFANPIKE